MKKFNKKVSINTQNNIKKLFDNKGYTAPIAEKSVTNFQYISLNINNRDKRLYYFAIGHKFKNMGIPMRLFFRKEYSKIRDEFVCKDFMSLQESFFTEKENEKHKNKFINKVSEFLEKYLNENKGHEIPNNKFVRTISNSLQRYYTKKIRSKEEKDNLIQEISKMIIYSEVYDNRTNNLKSDVYLAFQEYNSVKDKQDNERTFADDIGKWLSKIRNLNNHYVHTFDKMRIDRKDSIKQFLTDSFKIATTNIFLSEYKDKTSITKDNIDLLNIDLQKEYNFFLKDKFKKELEDIRDKEKLRIKDCIEKILFFSVDKDFSYDIKMGDENHKIMTVKKGEYMTFISTLFLITMFLYKDEAEMIISKISDFKENDTEDMRSKRNIMTFFSKKRSSQDYSSEEKPLVYFRDIIQYLNKYPTVWNRDNNLDNETDNDLSASIRESIERIEIDRLFPTMKEDNDFKEYAINHIFRNKEVKPKKRIYKDIIEKNDEVRAVYDIIRNNPRSIKEKEYKDNTFKQYVLKYVVNNYYKNNDTLEKIKAKRFDRWKEKEFEEELNTNKKVKKLKERLKSKLFYTSYGRNQDRFMETAIRFLAEENYFGKDAKFKMYQFYTTDEQNNYLDEQNRELEYLKEKGTKEKYIKKKKSIDGFKYHGGKLTVYRTYDEHKSFYPEWDTPFVVENNSVQVIIPDENNEERGFRFSVQRSLMVYILQDYLFVETKPKGSGKELLTDYFEFYKKEFKIAEKSFNSKSKDNIDFSLMSKLLPSRAIQQMFSEIKQQTSLEAFRKILNEAKENEKRYNEQKNIPKEAYGNFIKKNKGKQFKLNFVRKAWHLMYFKDIYKKYAPTKADHHKSLHITRDEYNDFCRYMFAMDAVPHYKELLRDMLEKKSFFSNKKFEALFEECNTLECYYKKTKEIFEKWIEELEKDSAVESLKDRERYSLDKYHNLNYTEDDVYDKILYINLSHFISYLRKENRLMTEIKKGIERIVLPAVSQNKVNLIGDYYKNLSKDKSIKKACKELMKTRFEDCLLYEIALRYFGKRQEVTNAFEKGVNEILRSKIVFPIYDKAKINILYNIEVPFNKIEKYVGIVSHRNELYNKQKGKNEDKSFLSNLPIYLDYMHKEKEKEDARITKRDLEIINRFGTSKTISLEDFSKIQSDIVKESINFLVIYMALEKFFILKHKTIIPKNKNFIKNKNIKEIGSYVSKDIRDTACHFGIPTCSDKKLEYYPYANIIDKIKRDYIEENNIENKKNISKAEKELLNILENKREKSNSKKYNKKFQKQKTKKKIRI